MLRVKPLDAPILKEALDPTKAARHRSLKGITLARVRVEAHGHTLVTPAPDGVEVARDDPPKDVQLLPDVRVPLLHLVVLLQRVATAWQRQAEAAHHPKTGLEGLLAPLDPLVELPLAHRLRRVGLDLLFQEVHCVICSLRGVNLELLRQPLVHVYLYGRVPKQMPDEHLQLPLSVLITRKILHRIDDRLARRDHLLEVVALLHRNRVVVVAARVLRRFVVLGKEDELGQRLQAHVQLPARVFEGTNDRNRAAVLTVGLHRLSGHNLRHGRAVGRLLKVVPVEETVPPRHALAVAEEPGNLLRVVVPLQPLLRRVDKVKVVEHALDMAVRLRGHPERALLCLLCLLLVVLRRPLRHGLEEGVIHRCRPVAPHRGVAVLRPEVQVIRARQRDQLLVRVHKILRKRRPVDRLIGATPGQAPVLLGRLPVLAVGVLARVAELLQRVVFKLYASAAHARARVNRAVVRVRDPAVGFVRLGEALGAVLKRPLFARVFLLVRELVGLGRLELRVRVLVVAVLQLLPRKPTRDLALAVDVSHLDAVVPAAAGDDGVPTVYQLLQLRVRQRGFVLCTQVGVGLREKGTHLAPRFGGLLRSHRRPRRQLLLGQLTLLRLAIFADCARAVVVDLAPLVLWSGLLTQGHPLCRLCRLLLLLLPLLRVLVRLPRKGPYPL